MPRPKLPLDEAYIHDLIQRGATNQEIADVVGCDDQTIINRFSKILKRKRAERRIKLREAQWKKAMKGHPMLLIFLGKNMLEQSDRVTHRYDQEAPKLVRVTRELPAETLRVGRLALNAPASNGDTNGDGTH